MRMRADRLPQARDASRVGGASRCADLHVITGAIVNHADELCTAYRKLLAHDPIGSLHARTPPDLAEEPGLIDPEPRSQAPRQQTRQ